MGIVLAIVFLALSAVTAITYGGTPHGGPTTECGPITVFNHAFTVHADCRYVSVGELLIAFFFFFLAVMAALSARPRG
jgi:hypothetical protein